MSSIAVNRLNEERKKFRKEHPHGFWVKCMKNPDGSLDLFKWEAGIPGQAGTLWEGGEFRLVLEFPKDYPTKPPKCRFSPPLFHPNVFPSGTVCLSILSEEKDWNSSISVKEILMGIQDLLDHPNEKDPAHQDAYLLFTQLRPQYERKIKQQALERRPVGE